MSKSDTFYGEYGKSWYDKLFFILSWEVKGCCYTEQDNLNYNNGWGAVYVVKDDCTPETLILVEKGILHITL